MSARNKAARRVMKSQPTWTIRCETGGLPNCSWTETTKDRDYWCTGPKGGRFNLTNRHNALRHFRMQGWTWDKDGNWLCPVCSKGDER